MKDGQDFIVNIQIVEYIGLFKTLNPHGPKIYDVNIYKTIAKVEILFLTVALVMGIFSMYYTLNDANPFFFYLMVVVGIFDFSLNHIYVIKYSDAIWDFMSVTKLDFLSFKTLKFEKFKYKMATTISLMSCLFIGVAWILLPFILQQDSYLTIHYKNDSYHYHYTSLNFITPVTTEFYNKNYVYFYIFDSIVVFCCLHTLIFYDFIVLTMCICIECQLSRIANAFSEFDYADKSTNSKHIIFVPFKKNKIIICKNNKLHLVGTFM